MLRGGTGIFTGRIPFVWIVSAKGNANTVSLQYSYDPSNSTGKYKPDFITDPAKLAATLLENGAVGAQSAPLTPTILSKNLKMPSTWKSSLAFDVQLPWGILGSVDAAYSKDFNGVIVTNVGLKDPTPNGLVISENDKRDLYNNGTYGSGKTYLLENMKGGKTGNYYSVSVKLQKTVRDFSAMVAYTRSGAKSLSDGIGDQVGSAWYTNTNCVQGTNSHELGYGTYVAPDRLIASISYKIKGTSLSLFYEGSQLGYFKGTGYSYTRFSYTFANAVVGDGGSSNLIYVPGSWDELKAMNFADMKDKGGNVTYSADDQKEDYWAYINQDKYLSSRKGKYTERGGAVMPWRNRFDFKFLQDINFGSEKKRHTIQIGLDIMNVGNLLNKNWGNIQQTNKTSILSRNTNGTLNFNMDGSQRLTQTFSKFPSLQSTYSMQLSLRYIFN